MKIVIIKSVPRKYAMRPDSKWTMLYNVETNTGIAEMNLEIVLVFFFRKFLQKLDLELL